MIIPRTRQTSIRSTVALWLICAIFIGKEARLAIAEASCKLHMFSCGDGRCISKEWVCDQDQDCINGTDEIECPVKENCSSGEFMCKTSKTCISARWLCDGDIDCQDESDEILSVCALHKQNGAIICDPEVEFQCEAGACIRKSWICDGDHDCIDGSDEGEICGKSNCSSGEFMCKTSKKCIATRLLCDGDIDCPDESDEKRSECVVHHQNGADICDPDVEFRCEDGRCIKTSWTCDGFHDCIHGSDEGEFCYVYETCNNDQFPCDDLTCISSSKACDGLADCPDSSDEHNCRKSNCSSGEFMCKTSKKCIAARWLCDGDIDCPDESDEKRSECVIHHQNGADICDPDVEFRCEDGRCIKTSWTCDGFHDCIHGSDEGEFCYVYETCNNDQFPCDDLTCIPSSKACDGLADCPDSSDEHNCKTENTTGEVSEVSGVDADDKSVPLYLILGVVGGISLVILVIVAVGVVCHKKRSQQPVQPDRGVENAEYMAMETNNIYAEIEPSQGEGHYEETSEITDNTSKTQTAPDTNYYSIAESDRCRNHLQDPIPTRVGTATDTGAHATKSEVQPSFYEALRHQQSSPDDVYDVPENVNMATDRSCNDNIYITPCNST